MKIETKQKSADLVIVGAGVPGICAAVQAARMGVSTILINNRGVVGGNSSCEIFVGIGGSCEGNVLALNSREGGIVDEIRQEYLFRSPHKNRYALDAVYMDKIYAEKNISLFLNTCIDEVILDENGEIVKVCGTQNTTETRWEFTGKWFVDDTGDGALGALAGAEFMIGREASSTFGEKIAPEKADGYCIPSTLNFTAKDMGFPVKYVAPNYADDVRPALQYREIPHQGFCSSQWYYEVTGELDQVKDREELLRQHRSLVAGIWDYIKNSGEYPEAANYDFDYISTVPGMREYRRLVGDYILTEQDLAQQVEYDDAVSHGGWNFDLHAIKGFYDNDLVNRHINAKGIYQIPYRAGYSKNIKNMFMCGRCMSMSHVAFGSVRVAATLSAFGQAIGMAAYLCEKYDVLPADIYAEHRKELQQLLLKEDQLIPGVKNEDPADLALQAHVTASSEMLLNQIPGAGSYYMSMKDALCLSLPVRERLDALTVTVRAEKDTELRCAVYKPSKPYNYGPDLYMKTVSVPVRKGTSNVRIPVEINDGGSYYLFELCSNDLLHVLTATGQLPATIMFRKEVNHSDTDWDYELMRKKDFTFRRLPDCACFRAEPAQRVYAPGNINNGYNRAYGQPNTWMSDPADPLPQVTLSWENPVTVSQIQLTFFMDTTSSIDHYPLPVFPSVGVDYRILAVRNGNETEVAAVKDNHMKCNRHHFEPVTCDAICICFDRGVDGSPVGLYEVRAEA